MVVVVYPVPWDRVTVLVEADPAGVVDTELDACADEEVTAAEVVEVCAAVVVVVVEPPLTMWKGKEYWKVSGLESSWILKP